MTDPGQRPGRLTAAGAVAVLAGLGAAGLAGSARVSPAGIMWGLGEAVSLAAYFLLSAAAGDQVLPPLVSAVIAYVAGIAAARRLGARLASFTGMAEVLFAVLYAWLLLGQMPSPAELTGGALMLTGVILIRADDTRRSALT